MDRVKLVVHTRDVAGSREARRLRRRGLIPAVLYGSGKPAVSIAVDEHALRDAVGTGAGLHAVLDVVIEGHKQPHVAIVKEYELDKVKHVVTHVDFQESQAHRAHRVERDRDPRGHAGRRQPERRPARRRHPRGRP